MASLPRFDLVDKQYPLKQSRILAQLRFVRKLPNSPIHWMCCWPEWALTCGRSGRNHRQEQKMPRIEPAVDRGGGKNS